MAKLTLLSIVQDILNDMDSDYVNSINDTEEALQVAQIIKTSYEELIADKNWPHLMTVTQLESVVDSNPAKLKLPELCKELSSLEYNVRKDTDTRDKYMTMEYLHPVHFIRKLNKRNSGESNVDTVIDYGNTKLYIRNDQSPRYWTSFDDEYIIFDAYDNEVDTTIQGSKTQVVMFKSPVFDFTDTFIPDLPEEAFPALVAEAKSTAFFALKQVNNAKAEQKARRSRAWLSRKAWRAKGGANYPDFGRSGYKRRHNPYLEK